MGALALQFIWQAGRAHVDVMLQPSWTWPPLSQAHLVLDRHRSIEHGFNTFRCCRQGVSAAIDGWGRVIATAADPPGATEHRPFIADLPARRVPTAYSVIMDAFAWVAGFLLTVIVLFAVCAPPPRPACPPTLLARSSALGDRRWGGSLVFWMLRGGRNSSSQ